MVDTVAENTYIRSIMSRLPEEKPQGEVHVIKNGESLWSIAKKAVSVDGKAKKGEINDYMLRLAKLNGLDTYEKMNNVKTNTKLYMPEKLQKNQKVGSTGGAQKKQAVKPLEAKERSSAEKSLFNVMSTIVNDKTIFIEQPRLGTRNKMYHVYNSVKTPKYMSYKHPVVSFTVDERGNFLDATFEDVSNNINPIGYDYILDKTGRIYKNKHALYGQQVGKISKEELDQLMNMLNELRTKAKSVI